MIYSFTGYIEVSSYTRSKVRKIQHCGNVLRKLDKKLSE